MEPLHILYLIDSLRRGGAELLLLGMTKGMLRAGFAVSVGYSTPGPLEADFTALGVPLYPLPRAARVDPLLFARMARLVRRVRPDVVHTHLFKSDFHGRLAARLMGVAVVVSTLHSADPWAARWLPGRIYGLTARCADRLIAVSEPVRRYHLVHTGVSAAKVVTIENGVDLTRFADLKSAGRTSRVELGIPPDAPLLGVVGRLVPDKGQGYFLRAAVRIRTAHSAARFLLVGDGPQEAKLRAQARSLGLEEAVGFTGFREDIPAVMAALDILVIPSLREGLPLTLLEAMAAGTPVVATDTGGVAGVLQGEAGLVVPPGAADALAEACLQLLAAPDLRQRMGAAGREIVAQRYSLTRTVERLAALYRQLASEKGLSLQIQSPVHVFEVTKSTGGVGEYVRWIANGLDKARFRLTVACLSEGGEAFAAQLNQLPSVEAFSLPMARYRIAPLSDLRVFLRLRAAIRGGDFDLIHAHASKPGFLARLAAAGSDVPVLYSPHCFAFHPGARPILAVVYAWLERWAARRMTTRFVAVAQAECELGRAYGVGHPGQYVTVHSGIDPRPFERPFDPAETRQSLGIPESTPLVGVVGRLCRQKNPLGFVESARLVHQARPETHFVWVGDGPLMEAAQARARAAGLQDVFHLVGARRDIPDVLRVLDVFALPSLWEAFPITILEAMAARRPVVATDVMGVPEAVIDGETGLLVAPGDAPAFAQALLSLLADTGLRARMAAAARQRLETHFRRDQMLTQLAALYQENAK